MVEMNGHLTIRIGQRRFEAGQFDADYTRVMDRPVLTVWDKCAKVIRLPIVAGAFGGMVGD